MAIDRFFIGPYDAESGLQTNYKPYAIPDTAFARLENAYVFRGRVRKRFGSRWTTNTGNQLNSRLRVFIGTTGGAIVLPNNPATGGTQLAIGQIFSIGTDIFTIWQVGAGVLTYSTVSGKTATINTTVNPNTVVFTGEAAAQAVFWYPSLPVMGFITYENGAVNLAPTIAFDTRFSYQYNPTTSGWDNLSVGVLPTGAAVWRGTDSDFFWGSTWKSSDGFTPLLFVTNNNTDETQFLRYWNGTIWTSLKPPINTGGTINYLRNCKLLVPFRNRMLAFNTFEGPDVPGGNRYVNRCRYSKVGSPIDADAWYADSDNPGKGGAIDATTTEAITGVEFVKDRLIVFFERSVYELAYNGNQVYPFVFNKLNNELGIESENSVVQFDKVCIGIGSTGIHACNGSNVERIDEKIPEEIFEIHNLDDGVFRVAGIRDFFTEMIYWSYPDTTANSDFPYPNKVLVFNYKTGSWAMNDDSFTALGYFFDPMDASPSWDDNQITWDDPVSWDSGTLQANFREVLAGNQQGYIVIIDSEESINAPALQITDISISNFTTTITAIKHNLRTGDYVLIQNIVSTGTMATLLNNTIVSVIVDMTAPDTFTFLVPVAFTGAYAGGGTIARVSQIDILTKQYNFYLSEGRNCYVSRVDFQVDKTVNGEIQVAYYSSTSDVPLLQDSITNGAILGTGNLETFPYPTVPFEANSTRLWHPIYLQSEGEFIQLQLVLSQAQMTTVIVNSDNSITGPALEDFQLHSMIIHAQKTSSRLQ